MSDIQVREEGVLKYFLVEWLAQGRLNPDLKGTEAALLDLDHFPKDILSLGKALGIPPKQLTEWMGTAAIRKATSDRIRQISGGYLTHHIEDVNRMLVAQAKDGDKDAMKLFYQRVDKEVYDADPHSLVGENKKGDRNAVQITVLVKNILEKQGKDEKWDDMEFDDAEFQEV